MRPLVIVGTCKELHKCARLLDRFGYIPVNCRIPTCDNHDGGFIILNREGEFRFSTCNLYANLDCMVTASDFLKNYGGFRNTQPVQPKERLFCLHAWFVGYGYGRKPPCRKNVAIGFLCY